MAAKKDTTKQAPAKAPAKQIAVRKTGTDLATIDAELANEVANIKDAISQGSGNKMKVEVVGDFVTPDGMNLGNEIQVVVVDFVSHNKFYTTAYDPQNPTPPDCYAMGRKINEMAPEPDSPNIQNADCRTCPLNQFSSGQNGRGKACKNSRALAVLVVDPENPDAHNEPDAPIYLLEIPPTGLRSFDGAVGHIARALNGPPVKAILTVTAKNAGTYALITFLDPVPNPDYAAHAARRPEVQDLLFRKPDYDAYNAKQAAAPRGRKPAARQPATRAPARR